MLFLIILLSVALVLDCVVLVFLVLMQLPKKEAGAGLAFGGAATDALFGAGSGNFLTKATKYTAGIFFALSIVLSLLQSYRAHQPGSDFLERVKRAQEQPAITAPPAPAAPAAPQPMATPANTNVQLLNPVQSAPAVLPTNAPATIAAPTNASPATSAPQK
jgi:preprotein translocase subunit SecG